MSDSSVPVTHEVPDVKTDSDQVTVSIETNETIFTYGEKLKILWSQEGEVPKGSHACVTLRRKTDEHHFAFPATGGACIDIAGTEPTRSVTGELIRTSGYDLTPGDYRVVVILSGPAIGGKDGGVLATAKSNYITIKTNVSVATCNISTNKSTYVVGEDVDISWSSSNADLVTFTNSNVAELLDLPSGSQRKSGSKSTTAQGKGRMTIEMQVEDEDGNSNSCSRVIEVTPASVSMSINGRDTGSLQAGLNESLEVLYFPIGEIESCAITGTYRDGDYQTEHQFNQWIDRSTVNGYGRAYFQTIMTYKGDALGPIESIDVECAVDGQNDIRDRVVITLPESSVTNSYTIEVNGNQITSGTGVTLIEAHNQYNKEVGTYRNTSDNDVMTCYWGEELIKTNTGWKG